jgi:flagellar export protein FliJ
VSAFRFRMARLQHVRGLEEQIARELFLSADRTAREAESAADAARLAITDAERELRAVQSKPRIDIRQLFAHQRHLDRRRELRMQALARARALRVQAEGLRSRWSERRQELRGLERLEERDLEAWRQDELVREARELDEVAIARARRNKLERDSTLVLSTQEAT